MHDPVSLWWAAISTLLILSSSAIAVFCVNSFGRSQKYDPKFTKLSAIFLFFGIPAIYFIAQSNIWGEPLDFSAVMDDSSLKFVRRSRRWIKFVAFRDLEMIMKFGTHSDNSSEYLNLIQSGQVQQKNFWDLKALDAHNAQFRNIKLLVQLTSVINFYIIVNDGTNNVTHNILDFHNVHQRFDDACLEFSIDVGTGNGWETFSIARNCKLFQHALEWAESEQVLGRKKDNFDGVDWECKVENKWTTDVRMAFGADSTPGMLLFANGRTEGSIQNIKIMYEQFYNRSQMDFDDTKYCGVSHLFKIDGSFITYNWTRGCYFAQQKFGAQVEDRALKQFKFPLWTEIPSESESQDAEDFGGKMYRQADWAFLNFEKGKLDVQMLLGQGTKNTSMKTNSERDWIFHIPEVEQEFCGSFFVDGIDYRLKSCELWNFWVRYLSF